MVVLHERIAQIDPFVAERLLAAETDISGEVLLWSRFHRQVGSHVEGDSSITVDHGPCVRVPPHRSQISLAACQMVHGGLRTEGQTDYPPGTVGSINQVGMSCALNGTVLAQLVAMRQDGVGGIANVRPVNVG